MIHKRPHIKAVVGPHWNSLVGYVDWSAMGIRFYECKNDYATGVGCTPKQAYDAWNKDLLRPYQNGPEFMAAFRLAQTPR